jgi:hypothetical protein
VMLFTDALGIQRHASTAPDDEKPKVSARRHLRPEEAQKLIAAAGKRGPPPTIFRLQASSTTARYQEPVRRRHEGDVGDPERESSRSFCGWTAGPFRLGSFKCTRRPVG